MRPATARWIICALAPAAWAVASDASAQLSRPETPGVLLEQQRKAEEQRKKQEQFLQPQAPPLIEKPASPSRPQEGGEAKVTVTRFNFHGNTVIPTKELEEVVAPSIGKDLTLRELNRVADLVSDHYIGKGYILGRAYLPPQEILGGVVEIALFEGKVGTMSVQGNTSYRSSTILRALEPVARKAAIHESTLETALTELNEYPGLKVRADLKSGASPGTTDVHMTAQERIPYTVGVDVNNYGSQLTGPWLYGTDIGIGNVLGLGDNLTFRGTKSDDMLFFTNIGYLVPVTSFGTRLQLAWVHSENVIGGTAALDAVRPVGRADIVSADLLQTITRTGAFSLIVVGGFDFKTVRNIFTFPLPGTAPLQSKDELRIFRLGLRGDYRDDFLGRTYFGVTWHRGVDFWGGSKQDAPGTSFTDAGPGNWGKATADLSRFQSLGLPIFQNLPVVPAVLNDSYLILRATGQIASDRLLSPERFTIGGYYTVRGYPVAESIGDHGYVATAELVVPVPSSSNVPFTGQKWKDMVQIAVFIDHGATFVSPVSAAPTVTPQIYLTGAGGGLRVNVPLGLSYPGDRGTLSVKIDWASAIGRPRPSSRDQGLTLHPITGSGEAGTLYVSAALKF